MSGLALGHVLLLGAVLAALFGLWQLSIWLRNKEGGMVNALKVHPTIGLLYRDSNTRSTLSIQGNAYVEEDPEICARVWDNIQDVEQKHRVRRAVRDREASSVEGRDRDERFRPHEDVVALDRQPRLRCL